MQYRIILPTLIPNLVVILMVSFLFKLEKIESYDLGELLGEEQTIFFRDVPNIKTCNDLTLFIQKKMNADNLLPTEENLRTEILFLRTTNQSDLNIVMHFFTINYIQLLITAIIAFSVPLGIYWYLLPKQFILILPFSILVSIFTISLSFLIYIGFNFHQLLLNTNDNFFTNITITTLGLIFEIFLYKNISKEYKKIIHTSNTSP